MTKIKLRKRNRKLFFDYYPFIPLRYFKYATGIHGEVGSIGCIKIIKDL